MKKFFLKNKLLLSILTIILAIFWAIFGGMLFFRFVERSYVYPLNYKENVYTSSEKFGIDPLIIFSIIKIESGFDNSALSDKGAIGLMQITPSTGKYIADMLNQSTYDLKDATTNIEFGTYYIKYLINRFENIYTAVIAYNAGEGNVSAWLNNSIYSQNGKTLKIIPFTETNEYINKFKKTFEKYNKLYLDIVDK